MQSLKDVLDRLGLKQSELARLLDVSPRTVSLWSAGDAPLPGSAKAYLRLLKASSPAVVAAELNRLTGRKKMFDEGIYGLSYKVPNLGSNDSGEALAVLRNGKILGSDRWGGVFAGSYEFDTTSQTNKFHVRVDVPPAAELVTGFSAGPRGATLDIVAMLERPAPVATATVAVAGQPLELELRYLGPLPN